MISRKACPNNFYNRGGFIRISILNTASSETFSSDRVIREYCDQIWGVQPIRRPS